MTTIKNELKSMCEGIRGELTRLYNADYTEEQVAELEENGEPTNLYDYFTNVLDFEYTINADKSYKAVRVWVTLGGPNICIDTRYNEVRGFWGSDEASAWLPSEIAEEIDNIFEEFYNC